MPDKTFDILIDIRARLTALQDATSQMAGLRRETEAAASAAQNFMAGLTQGVGIELTRQFERIPQLIGEWINEGVKFNALLETGRIGVAGMLRQFDGAKYKDFNAALGDSNRLIDLLRGKANQLGLSFESMLEQYRTTAGALFAGGVRDLQKQVDLTVLLQQAVGSLGITGFQAQRDIFDLLEGRSARTIAGKALGITDADIEKAKEAGHLYEFLTEKFGALSQAGTALGNTFTASQQRAKNLSEQLAGIVTQDVFGHLKQGLDSFNTALGDPKAREAAAGVGGVLGDWVTKLSSALERAQAVGAVFEKLPGTLPWLSNTFGGGSVYDKRPPRRLSRMLKNSATCSSNRSRTPLRSRNWPRRSSRWNCSASL